MGYSNQRKSIRRVLFLLINLMRAFYTLSIRFYALLIGIAALFNNKKAKQWKEGRNNWEATLAQKIKTKKAVIWFHAASLGEFEQARPLIEKIKKEKAEYFILLTFFSPSGFEIRKNYDQADAVCYLPLDTPYNAKKFIVLINPELTVFIKYEFWFNYLNQLQKKGKKTVLVSGIFRPTQHFFRWYGSWFRKQLSVFNTFFLQNTASEKLLHSIAYHNTLVTGDTRFDRVYQLAQEVFENKTMEQFCNKQKTLIVGSSWEKENEFARRIAEDTPNLKLIIAPHEVQKSKVLALKNSFDNKVILWSEIKESTSISDFNVLIIDQIGMLSKIYRYATIALIGGGFGAGIHNILEAAVYGCPVVFGPRYKKFTEAVELIELKGAFSIKDYNSFKNCIQQLISNQTLYQKASTAAESYVSKNAGASQQIYQSLF